MEDAKIVATSHKTHFRVEPTFFPYKQYHKEEVKTPVGAIMAWLNQLPRGINENTLIELDWDDRKQADFEVSAFTRISVVEGEETYTASGCDGTRYFKVVQPDTDQYAGGD